MSGRNEKSAPRFGATARCAPFESLRALSMVEGLAPVVEAAGAGFYDSPWGTKHPRLQILTVVDLLGGKGIDMPQTRDLRTFKKAPKAKRKTEDTQGKLIKE